MRAFLLFLFTSFFILTNYISYSQEEECANEIPGFFTDEQEAAIRDINLEVTKLIRAKRNRSVDTHDYYIPVIINLLAPPNPPGPYTGTSGHSIYSIEHALWFIDKLNETYNTSYGHYDNGQDPIPGFQQDSARIYFVPAVRDINNIPGFQWFRVFNLESMQDQIPQLTNTCDINDIYYSFESEYIGQTTPIWIPYIGNNSFYVGHNIIVWASSSCLSTHGSPYSTTLQDLVAYEPDEYLNINIVDGVYGSIGGFASLPGSGNRCFFRSSVYANYGSTAPHEVGHFLGLSHTFTGTECEASLNEFNNPNACDLTGDKVCDTYPTKKDWDPCYSTDPEHHCNIYEELIPTEHWNIMDYTGSCTHENFTPGQIERMRNMLEISERSAHAARGLLQLDPFELCGDTEACNYSPVAAEDYDPINCAYSDILGVCGGSCTADTDSDGVCDDIDGCIDIDGTLDLNNNGICDEDDPCGTLTEIDGIFIEDGVSKSVPVIAIGNRCWSSMNSRVDVFRDGSPIPQINTRSLFRSEIQNEEPFRSRPTILGDNESEPNTSFIFNHVDFYDEYVYNWYAVTDSRGMCPSGWHVSTDDDWIDLERAIGYTENQIIRPKREAVGPSFYLIDDIKFFNTYENWPEKEITMNPYANPIGYVDQYGIPREHAKKVFIWTTDEYRSNNPNYKQNNVYYRRIETTSKWYPVDYNSITALRQSWFSPSINRDYMLNSTSNTKFAAMSVRCVKDID